MTPEQYLATVEQATTAQVAEGTGLDTKTTLGDLRLLRRLGRAKVETGHLTDDGEICNCIAGFDRPVAHMWRRTP